jgi:Flp pilus assembly protein TadG
VTRAGAKARPALVGRRHQPTGRGAGNAGQGGSVTVELVLLAPVLLALLGLIVGLGRIADAGGLVTGAARDGARAASLARSPQAAATAARTAAADDLAGAGLACPGLDVATDTAGFAPGGLVRVTVRCTVRLADLAVPGLPGTRTLWASSAAPLERYRSG